MLVVGALIGERSPNNPFWIIWFYCYLAISLPIVNISQHTPAGDNWIGSIIFCIIADVVRRGGRSVCIMCWNRYIPTGGTRSLLRGILDEIRQFVGSSQNLRCRQSLPDVVIIQVDVHPMGSELPERTALLRLM